MAKKKFDPKAKAKRQKVIAAVGGVILLGVLAFQVPRTLKMLHQSNASAADSTPTATTSNTTATGPIAAPSLGGGNATASAASNVSSDGVNDPDVLPTPQSGQLLAFSRFRSKDPFSQQIGLDCASGGSQQGCASTSSGTSSGGTKSPVKSVAASVTTTVTPSRGGAAKLTSAVISVNGTSETVHVGASFPASAPTFKLVSLTKTSARVGIAGGSLASGNQTVTLKLNKQLTLMNTADGTRYVLRLLSVK
jgi:hypothetical protein